MYGSKNIGPHSLVASEVLLFKLKKKIKTFVRKKKKERSLYGYLQNFEYSNVVRKLHQRTNSRCMNS